MQIRVLSCMHKPDGFNTSLAPRATRISGSLWIHVGFAPRKRPFTQIQVASPKEAKLFQQLLGTAVAMETVDLKLVLLGWCSLPGSLELTLTHARPRKPLAAASPLTALCLPLAPQASQAWARLAWSTATCTTHSARPSRCVHLPQPVAGYRSRRVLTIMCAAPAPPRRLAPASP